MQENYGDATFADAAYKSIEPAIVEYIRQQDPKFELSELIETAVAGNPDMDALKKQIVKGLIKITNFPIRSRARQGLVEVLKGSLLVYYLERYCRLPEDNQFSDVIFVAWSFRDRVENAPERVG